MQHGSESAADAAERYIITIEGLDTLIDALKRSGRRVIGPTLRDQAIVYDDIGGVADLPAGWTDVQDGGTYRVKRRADNALFGYAVGPHSWKNFLHPSRIRLWRAEKNGDGVSLCTDPEPTTPFAFIGARACDLRAIGIQDRVFLGGSYVDPHYQARRKDAFIVATNCGEAGGTCFCVSMGTGPKADSGFDLALTELVGGTGHVFLVEIGTERGKEVLDQVPHGHARQDHLTAGDELLVRTAANMGRKMRTDDIHPLLLGNLEHPRWDDVASRCLTCGNCTMVCPTCFCTSVEDTSDLAGGAERSRRWDSCFTEDFSYVHGGSVRQSARSRYRQWMTHKLATWIDQFGSSGCVGCGRCITWCPVGIDITEEVSAIREQPATGEGTR